MKFENPEINVAVFDVEDVITASSGIKGDGNVSGSTPDEPD